MITEILCICMLICVGFIVKMKMMIEDLEMANQNCHHHIAFLGSMIRDMENKLQESKNGNDNH